MTQRLGFMFAALGAIVLANSASATIISIGLSDFASEPIDPSILAATFDFSVTGQTLTLTVTNNTSVPNEYSINRIYFNANANVGNLTSSSTGQFDVNAISGMADRRSTQRRRWRRRITGIGGFAIQRQQPQRGEP